MGYFLLYWIIGVIIIGLGWLNLNGKLTVGHLFGVILAGLIWPLVTAIVVYVHFEDKVLFEKKDKDGKE